MKYIVMAIVLFSIAGLVYSCTKGKESMLAAQSGITCDTTNATFAQNVEPIFQANCNSCHSASNSSAGYDLSSYSGVLRAISRNKLMGTITHASGFTPMPEGAAKLSDCDIATIQAWINRGYPNN